MSFKSLLNRCVKRNNSLVCVGLDSDIDKIPHYIKGKDSGEVVVEFNKAIIDATKDLVCAYKLNIAFYEMLGVEGIEALRNTKDYIPDYIPAILDAKRADIGNTSRAYARAVFEQMEFDAVTVNPYMGKDSLEPFMNYKDRGTFVLCRTSNPGSRDFQDLSCQQKPLYQKVAEKISEWNQLGNLAAVVGATFPSQLKEVRAILGEEVSILIPGVGKQEGDLERAVKNGTNSSGEQAIINSSRSIIFASSESNFPEAARQATQDLRKHINTYR